MVITVIATIEAKEGREDYIKFQLCKLVRPTLAEYGCLTYGFYQDSENPCLFNSFERWANEFALEKHLASKHIKDYLEATDDDVEEFVIRKFTKIC